jgi:hypothetical protein
MQHYFLCLFPLYRQLLESYGELKAAHAELATEHENFMAHKRSISRIGGMNQKQVEEMKNYYLNSTGRLPGDDNEAAKPAAKDDASNFSDLARSIHAARMKKLDL